MTRITVVLELEGPNEENAYDIVDNILDDGVFQDAINDFVGGDIEVKSAIVSLELPSKEEPSS